MGFEPFEARKALEQIRLALDRFLAVSNERRPNHEVVDSEGRCEPCRASCRQYVTRTRRIIARCLGCLVTNEGGTSGIDALEHALGVRDLQGKMLGRKHGSDASSFRTIVDDEAGRMACNADLRDVLPWKHVQLALEFPGNLACIP